MADGSKKAIEEVKIGDEVLAFDERDKQGRGKLHPAKVTETFVNHNQKIINFHGLKCTPGHVFLTGTGAFLTLEQILAEDGTVVTEKGKLIRARTGREVGSPSDQPIPVAWDNPATGNREIIYMRADAPCARLEGDESKVYSISAIQTSRGFKPMKDGRFRGTDGEAYVAWWDPYWGSPFDVKEARDQIVKDPETDLGAHPPSRATRRRLASIARHAASHNPGSLLH